MELVIHKKMSPLSEYWPHLCGDEDARTDGCCKYQWKDVTCKDCLKLRRAHDHKPKV